MAIPFLMKGVIRGFYLAEDDSEATDCLITQALLLFYNRILTGAVNQYWLTQNKMIRGTTMERYMWFLETYPGLINQIGNRYVASFLAMTPVTLSRLRCELKNKE